MKKLTVIMPVYNVGQFIKRSVDSVLAQTYPNIEIILVDDGSIDDGAKICDEYAAKDRRITVVHKKNAGAGSARNCGLTAARGEYVAFPDSDDWVEKDAYGYCIDLMEKDSIDLLLFGSINTEYMENGEVSKEILGKTADIKYTSEKDCKKGWIDLVTSLPMDGPSNKMYKMDIIEKNKVVFPDIRRMQDGVFNMRYFDNIRSFAAVPEYFYHFTMHSASYQRKKIPASFLACAIKYHDTAINMLKKWGEFDENAEKKLGSWFSGTVLSAALEFYPEGSKSFLNRFNHVKKICRDPYVVEFYKRYKKVNKLNKRELAVYRGHNLLLTIYSLLK